MKTPGQALLTGLKNPDILSRKPGLKLCPNHYRDKGPRIHRMWRWTFGTAVCDGNGWYKPQSLKEK
jgi:hypothetical protein